DGLGADGKHVLRALVRQVRHVDDDAQPVAFLDDIDAEVGEATGAALAHAVADLVAHIVGEAQAAQPEAIEIAQIRDLLLERSAALQADHHGNLSLALGAANICGRPCQYEVLGRLHLGTGVVERAHEALQVPGRKARRRQVSIGSISTDVVANHGYAACAQGWQVPALQHAAFTALPSPVDVGGDDVAVADDDDSLLMELASLVGHAGAPR